MGLRSKLDKIETWIVYPFTTSRYAPKFRNKVATVFGETINRMGKKLGAEKLWGNIGETRTTAQVYAEIRKARKQFEKGDLYSVTLEATPSGFEITTKAPSLKPVSLNPKIIHTNHYPILDALRTPMFFFPTDGIDIIRQKLRILGAGYSLQEIELKDPYTTTLSQLSQLGYPPEVAALDIKNLTFSLWPYLKDKYSSVFPVIINDIYSNKRKVEIYQGYQAQVKRELLAKGYRLTEIVLRKEDFFNLYLATSPAGVYKYVISILPESRISHCQTALYATETPPKQLSTSSFQVDNKTDLRIKLAEIAGIKKGGIEPEILIITHRGTFRRILKLRTVLLSYLKKSYSVLLQAKEKDDNTFALINKIGRFLNEDIKKNGLTAEIFKFYGELEKAPLIKGKGINSLTSKYFDFRKNITHAFLGGIIQRSSQRIYQILEQNGLPVIDPPTKNQIHEILETGCGNLEELAEKIVLLLHEREGNRFLISSPDLQKSLLEGLRETGYLSIPETIIQYFKSQTAGLQRELRALEAEETSPKFRNPNIIKFRSALSHQEIIYQLLEKKIFVDNREFIKIFSAKREELWEKPETLMNLLRFDELIRALVSGLPKILQLKGLASKLNNLLFFAEQDIKDLKMDDKFKALSNKALTQYLKVQCLNLKLRDGSSRTTMMVDIPYGSLAEYLVDYISELGQLKQVFYPATAGGISKNLKKGDITVPIFLESAGKPRLIVENILLKSESCTRILVAESESTILPGKHLSVKNPLHEDEKFIQEAQKNHLLSVDVEMYGVYAKIQEYNQTHPENKISFGAIAIISDLPGEKGKTIGESNEKNEHRELREAIFDCILDYVGVQDIETIPSEYYPFKIFRNIEAESRVPKAFLETNKGNFIVRFPKYWVVDAQRKLIAIARKIWEADETALEEKLEMLRLNYDVEIRQLKK